MKFISILFIALLAMVSGCGTTLYQYHSVDAEVNNQHYKIFPIYVDKSFNAQELATVDQVVADWNYVLNGYMKIQVQPVKFTHSDETTTDTLLEKIKQTNEGLMMVGANHDDPLIENSVADGDGKLAFVNALGERAFLMTVVRDRIGTKNLHKILLHEFGHSLGANHIQAVSLMYPYYGYMQMNCVDKITVAQVASYYNLDLNHMNYCSTPNFE